MNQLSLITQNSTWMHYIGRGFYAQESKFLREAKKQGISRRAPAQLVRGMEFGDKLVFLRYVKPGTVFAFAEARIIGVTLEQSISNQVGNRLIDEGRAEYQEGGAAVERECGTYLVVGTFTVKATLKEVMTIAAEIHVRENGDTPMFVMVNARLTESYKEQVLLSPSPKFTRGFIRTEYSYTPPKDGTPNGQVIAITDYVKKERSQKKEAIPLLPVPA